MPCWTFCAEQKTIPSVMVKVTVSNLWLQHKKHRCFTAFNTSHAS